MPLVKYPLFLRGFEVGKYPLFFRGLDPNPHSDLRVGVTTALRVSSEGGTGTSNGVNDSTASRGGGGRGGIEGSNREGRRRQKEMPLVKYPLFLRGLGVGKYPLFFRGLDPNPHSDFRVRARTGRVVRLAYRTANPTARVLGSCWGGGGQGRGLRGTRGRQHTR